MSSGSPYTPHTVAETEEMLEAIGVEEIDDLFDIPEAVTFGGDFGIPARSEQAIREEIDATLARNDELVSFLGRGHYDHYLPAVIDDLSGRSEFLTSYTQYQPEVAQGFLQALFEYQSMFVELTGLSIVNSSVYDAATALGEAATLAARVRETSGDRILVPTQMHDGRRSVLENYVEGQDMRIDTYPMDDGAVDIDALADLADDSTTMIYLASPTVRGVIEPNVEAVADLADEHDALSVLSSDPVALSVLEPPGELGVDVVIGDAAVLGLPISYGTGLGLVATRDAFLRQVPGRLVGAATDSDDRRTFTLTLQTREQHIRRERATSNICTNQAWVALRTAMHIAWLGPDGLVETAETCLRGARELASQLESLPGITAPAHDRYHFREFVVQTERDATELADRLLDADYAVHVLDDDHLQVCVTESNVDRLDEFVAAVEEVVR